MGEMSSMVSRSPSLRNQSNDSRWMSIRLGRSRTCLRRENDLRARGAVTELAKKKASLTGYEVSGEAEKMRAERDVRTVGATLHGTGGAPLAASARRGAG